MSSIKEVLNLSVPLCSCNSPSIYPSRQDNELSIQLREMLLLFRDNYKLNPSPMHLSNRPAFFLVVQSVPLLYENVVSRTESSGRDLLSRLVHPNDKVYTLG